MKKVSRHKTREFLFQALYSRIVLGPSFHKDEFLTSFYDEGFSEILDLGYFEEMFEGVVAKESELVAIIKKFAPRFDVQMMPVGNILPIFIAAYEMLYLTCDAIPEKVSIDEAIELSKTYSDDSARLMVNGVLNALKDHKEVTKSELENIPKNQYFF